MGILVCYNTGEKTAIIFWRYGGPLPCVSWAALRWMHRAYSGRIAGADYGSCQRPSESLSESSVSHSAVDRSRLSTQQRGAAWRACHLASEWPSFTVAIHHQNMSWLYFYVFLVRHGCLVTERLSPHNQHSQMHMQLQVCVVALTA